MNKTSNHFSCIEIKTTIGESIVNGNGVVESNVLKWTFILPVGTEITATIDGGRRKNLFSGS